MRPAVYSEDVTDEAAIRVFVDAIRGAPSLPVDPPRLGARGWPSVRDLLPTVLKDAYWARSADALVVVVDSDASMVHTAAHIRTPLPSCRVCELEARIQHTLAALAPRPAGTRLWTAVGLAVPAIEAWLLAGEHRFASEAAWARARQGNTHHGIKSGLKTALALHRLPDESMTSFFERMARHRAADLAGIEQSFPGGFESPRVQRRLDQLSAPTADCVVWAR